MAEGAGLPIRILAWPGEPWRTLRAFTNAFALQFGVCLTEAPEAPTVLKTYHQSPPFPILSSLQQGLSPFQLSQNKLFY